MIAGKAARTLWAAVVTLPLAAMANAASPLAPETVLVGASGAAPPTTETFTISTAEDLTITLTDLEVPTELASASVVVTQGDTLAGSASLAAPATTASFSLAGASGEYTLYVFGVPGTPLNLGAFHVCVAPKSSPAACIANASLSGSIALPAAANPAQTTLSATLTVTTAGAYTVTFADAQFPAPLQTTPNLGIFQGTQVVGVAIASGSVINLAAGTYSLLALAQAAASTQAGLFSLSITGPAGVAPLIAGVYPVGTLTAAAQPKNPVAQSITLKITDFGFPAKLGSASALVTAGSQTLGLVSGTGTTSFAAPAGALQLWSYAAAATGANAGAGFYEVDLTAPTGSLAQSVSGVGSGSTQAFAFTTPALTTGTSTATATDFQFPGALPSLQFAVAQAGALLGQSPVSSTLNFTAAAAPAFLLVAAAPPASGSGLFDVNVQGSAAHLEFDQTQPVSAASVLFSTQTVTFTTAGTYSVALDDLGVPAPGAPAPFQDLDLVVSSGATLIGRIIGSSSLSFSASPGPYQFTFLATPQAMQQFGLYGLSITSVPAPAVTLTASPASVSTGATTILTWTVSNATSCTGSGSGFPASPSVSGGNAQVTVSATTTYQITCTGAGGSTPASVTVAVAQSSSKSGGGALDPLSTGVLALLVGLGRFFRRRGAERR